MNAATFVFNRKLIAACAVTRHEAREGTIVYSSEVPTFESVFIDGQIAVGSTGSIMTAVFDESEIADENPTTSTLGEMPFDHACLLISQDILSKLISEIGPETVGIEVYADSVVWHFGDRMIEAENTMVHSDEYNADSDDENDDYHYPDYADLISRAIDETERLTKIWDELENPIFPSALSVTIGPEDMTVLCDIRNIIGAPGPPMPLQISGATPDYHIVRYYSTSGNLRHDIFSILGARPCRVGELSKFDVFPVFALKEPNAPFSIWRQYRDYTDDTSTVEHEDDDDNDGEPFLDGDDDA